MAKKTTIDLSGLSMDELDELAARVEERKVELREEQRQTALEAFQNIAGEYGMTPEEVLGVRRRRPRAASAAPKKRAPAKIKYRDPGTGKTWSGRGRRPAWVTEEMRV